MAYSGMMVLKASVASVSESRAFTTSRESNGEIAALQHCGGHKTTENRSIHYVQQNAFTARFAGHQNVYFRNTRSRKRYEKSLEVTLAIWARQITDLFLPSIE